MTGDADVHPVQELRDIEEIRQLKARYIEACDGGWGGKVSHDPETIAAMFTEDCEWDGGAFGNRTGHEALRAYYQQTDLANRPAAFHILTSPVIEVHGERASGRWHLTILLTLVEGTSRMICGTFEDEYRRTGEGWRIHRSNFSTAINSVYPGTLAFLA